METLGAGTGPIGLRRRFGGRPLSQRMSVDGPVHAYLLVCKATNEAAIIDTAAHPRRCAAEGGRDRRQADRDPADTRTRRSRKRFDGN